MEELLEIAHWGRLRNFQYKDRPLYIPRNPVRLDLSMAKQRSAYDVQRTFLRSTFVALSYKTYNIKRVTQSVKQNIATNTEDTIRYFFFENRYSGFDAVTDAISGESALERFSGEPIFKLQISPEDGVVLDREYVRKIMGDLQAQCGRRLKWVAVIHSHTGKRHVHIAISRIHGKGLSWSNPLHLDRHLVSDGIRRYADELATARLGRMSLTEYKYHFYRSRHTLGAARIDFTIRGNSRRGTNLFVDSGYKGYAVLSADRLAKLPKWQQELVLERLAYLSDNTAVGIRFANGQWRCHDMNWLDHLRDQEKLRPFADSTGGDPIHHIRPNAPMIGRIHGTVVQHTMIDDNSQRVGLLILDDAGQYQYVETELAYHQYTHIDGAKVSVAPKEAKTARYRLPQVIIEDTETQKAKETSPNANQTAQGTRFDEPRDRTRKGGDSR